MFAADLPKSSDIAINIHSKREIRARGPTDQWPVALQCPTRRTTRKVHTVGRVRKTRYTPQCRNSVLDANASEAALADTLDDASNSNIPQGRSRVLFLVCQHLSLGGCTALHHGFEGGLTGSSTGSCSYTMLLAAPTTEAARMNVYARVDRSMPWNSVSRLGLLLQGGVRPSSVHRKLWHVSARIAAADHVGTWPPQTASSGSGISDRVEVGVWCCRLASHCTFIESTARTPPFEDLPPPYLLSFVRRKLPFALLPSVWIILSSCTPRLASPAGISLHLFQS